MTIHKEHITICDKCDSVESDELFEPVTVHKFDKVWAGDREQELHFCSDCDPADVLESLDYIEVWFETQKEQVTGMYWTDRGETQSTRAEFAYLPSSLKALGTVVEQRLGTGSGSVGATYRGP